VVGSQQLLFGRQLDESLATNESGSTTFVLADGLQSATGRVTAQGSDVSRDIFDSWGTARIAVAEVLGFTSRERDEDNSIDLRARNYSPELGRFLSEDPVRFAEGVNFYVYARNTPALMVDPLGLSPNCCECPDSKWDYRGFSASIGAVIGFGKFRGTYTCRSKRSLTVDVEGECTQVGAFAQVGGQFDFSAGGLLPGAKACKASELLSDFSNSMFATWSIFGASGNAIDGTGSASLGLSFGAGVGGQRCNVRRVKPRPNFDF
jgi:RHS repeat-associated protein